MRDLSLDEIAEFCLRGWVLTHGRNTQATRGLDATDPGEERALRLILYDALASEAMGTLTTGVLLVGFAVSLGASNAAIGLLAAVPFFVQLLQLPAVLLVERVRARRDICVWSAAIGRCFLLAAAAAPLREPSAGIATLIGSLAVYQAMAAIGGCAWNSWMRDLVPESQYMVASSGVVRQRIP